MCLPKDRQSIKKQEKLASNKEQSTVTLCNIGNPIYQCMFYCDIPNFKFASWSFTFANNHAFHLLAIDV